MIHLSWRRQLEGGSLSARRLPAGSIMIVAADSAAGPKTLAVFQDLSDCSPELAAPAGGRLAVRSAPAGERGVIRRRRRRVLLGLLLALRLPECPHQLVDAQPAVEK